MMRQRTRKPAVKSLHSAVGMAGSAVRSKRPADPTGWRCVNVADFVGLGAGDGAATGYVASASSPTKRGGRED